MAQKSLAGMTLFITGASRGIGKAIALRAARDRANVIIAAKTTEPHPKLPGTIFTTAKEVEAAGGKCLPLAVDVRSEEAVAKAVQQAAAKFGGIDILVNNASAISLTGTLDTPAKRFDLMHQVNVRATYLCSQACIPYLKKGKNPHILNLSPPLNMKPIWFKDHVAYTMSKYGMSMCVLGMHEELRPSGIAVNALWPRTAIHTAAIELIYGAKVGSPNAEQLEQIKKQTRKPEILADAAHVILTQDAKACTGNFFVDEEVLKRFAKLTPADIESRYAYYPNSKPQIDFFLDEAEAIAVAQKSKAPSGAASASASAAAPSFGTGKVAGVWERVYKQLNDDVAKNVNAVFGFDLSGAEAGKWFLDLKTKTTTGSRLFRELPASIKAPEATFKLDSGDFLKLFSGQVSGASLFMTGKMKVSGDISQAMKLQKIFDSMRPK